MAKTMPKVRMTKEQRAWCKHYEAETGFEPLMDDFLYGNEPFVTAARFSVRWFEDWSSDAHLNIGRGIPGADEHDEVVDRDDANKNAASTSTNKEIK